jgi:pyruvate/2-oxoglutarate dehydrogenase complex dihydrolipoamide dehydrogenase (E3) component
MATNDHYDLLVLGSGQSGNPLSGKFSDAGKRAAVVERAFVAGTCINYGCTPTKTMVASARRAHEVRSAGELGVDVAAGFKVNLERIRQRKRDIVSQFRAGSERRFESGSPELIRGEASFIGPREVRVRLKEGGERTLTASVIVIDTGLSPLIPPIPGLDNVPYLDNVSLMELDAVPDHLVILGGGYLAVEFGQMFRRFGSEVTMLQKGPHLLEHEDEDVSDALAEVLRQDGIQILTGSEVDSVSGADGKVSVHVKGGERIAGSHLLVAVGRKPNTEALNLPAAGIKMDAHGYVEVNDKLETNVPGVYATGDVKGGPAFTHISYDDYRILRDNLLHGANRTTKGRLIPNVVYTDPQLGRVGLTEREARAQGRPYKLGKMPMTSVARANEIGETRGFMKALVDRSSGEILGVAVLGAEGGEIMSMVEIAMMGKLTYKDMVEAIFAHPAYSESLNNLFNNLDN